MQRFYKPVDYSEEKLRIGDVYFCLREMKPEVTTHQYEMCITSALDGSYVPVFLNNDHPFYQGVYAFGDKSDYDKILTAMRTGELELVQALETIGYKFKLWADALKYSLPNTEHQSYRATVA